MKLYNVRSRRSVILNWPFAKRGFSLRRVFASSRNFIFLRFFFFFFFFCEFYRTFSSLPFSTCARCWNIASSFEPRRRCLPMFSSILFFLLWDLRSIDDSIHHCWYSSRRFFILFLFFSFSSVESLQPSSSTKQKYIYIIRIYSNEF